MNTDEKIIRSLIDHWVESSCKGDIDAVMACYAPDIVAYDAILALQFRGVENYRKHWEQCMEYVHGEMLMCVPEVDITVGSDIAYAHYLSQCGCRDGDRTEQLGWIRGTVCLKKMDGQWRIAHEHYSAPFDPESMKALTELQP